MCMSAASAASTKELAGITCNESVACEKFVPSVAEQNQRLPRGVGGVFARSAFALCPI